MNNNVIIKVENVSKKYCKSLKRSMLYGIKDIGRNMLGMSSHSKNLRKGEFWALDDVSFEVKKGETLGIIGPNGAGKTTLLKLLNGIFWPDKGKITVKGKVGALIETGAGFHPLLTGRENVYINAAILGMTKKEVDKKFDDIIEFADIGDFLDAPVKFYSSGMFVRLGFAVAAHCEPDILLVDEVLAVGDMNFQRKCMERIRELKREGLAIILVSHSMTSIVSACTKAMLMGYGVKTAEGNTYEVVNEYNLQNDREAIRKESFPAKESRFEVEVSNVKIYQNDRIISERKDFVEIEFGNDFTVEFDYATKNKIENPHLSLELYKDEIRLCCLSTWNTLNKHDIPKELMGKGRVKIKIENKVLYPGIYVLGLIIKPNDSFHISYRETNLANFIIKVPEKDIKSERFLNKYCYIEIPNRMFFEKIR